MTVLLCGVFIYFFYQFTFKGDKNETDKRGRQRNSGVPVGDNDIHGDSHIPDTDVPEDLTPKQYILLGSCIVLVGLMLSDISHLNYQLGAWLMIVGGGMLGYELAVLEGKK